MTCYVSRITTDELGADGRALNDAMADALKRYASDETDLPVRYAYNFAGHRAEWSRMRSRAIIVEVQR